MEKVKVRNLHSGYEVWIDGSAVDRGVPANGAPAASDPFALMPEDWPDGTTDENNLWELADLTDGDESAVE